MQSGLVSDSDFYLCRAVIRPPPASQPAVHTACTKVVVQSSASGSHKASHLMTNVRRGASFVLLQRCSQVLAYEMELSQVSLSDKPREYKLGCFESSYAVLLQQCHHMSNECIV